MSETGAITRCYSLRYERASAHPVARVWGAITEGGEVSRWMGYSARVDLRVGGEYFVDFSRASPENLDGVIVAVEHEALLRYVWGLSVIEWKLVAAGAGCSYTFVHHGMPRRDIPDEEGVAVGWHAWLDSLERVLTAGRPGTVAENAADYERLSGLYRPLVAEVLGARESRPMATEQSA